MVASTKPETVVAEINKNWIDGEEQGRGLLSERFDNVIEVNRQRGYRLSSWSIGRTTFVLEGHTYLSETLVAVFVLKGNL